MSALPVCPHCKEPAVSKKQSHSKWRVGCSNFHCVIYARPVIENIWTDSREGDGDASARFLAEEYWKDYVQRILKVMPPPVNELRVAPGVQTAHVTSAA